MNNFLAICLYVSVFFNILCLGFIYKQWQATKELRDVVKLYEKIAEEDMVKKGIPIPWKKE